MKKTIIALGALLGIAGMLASAETANAEEQNVGAYSIQYTTQYINGDKNLPIIQMKDHFFENFNMGMKFFSTKLINEKNSDVNYAKAHHMTVNASNNSLKLSEKVNFAAENHITSVQEKVDYVSPTRTYHVKVFFNALDCNRTNLDGMIQKGYVKAGNPGIYVRANNAFYNITKNQTQWKDFDAKSGAVINKDFLTRAVNKEKTDSSSLWFGSAFYGFSGNQLLMSNYTFTPNVYPVANLK
jgi:hypothetical protein